MWLSRRNIRSVIDDGDEEDHRRNGDDDADDEDDVVNDEDTEANSKKTTQRNKREEDESINNVDSRDIENDDTRPLRLNTDEPNESTSNENGNETGHENGNENGNDKWYDKYVKARKQLSTVRIVLFVGLLLVNLLVLIYGVLFFTFDTFGGETKARPKSATTGTNIDRTFNDKQVVPGRIDLWRVTGLVALLNSIPPLVSLTVTTDTP